jgi:transcription termination factor Rho
MDKLALEHQGGGDPVDVIALMTTNIHELLTRAKTEFNIPVEGMPLRAQVVEQVMDAAWEARRALVVEGIVEAAQDGWGLLTYQHDNYRVRPLCAFIPRATMKRYAIKKGHIVKAFIQPPRKELTVDGNKENCPAVLKVVEIMGRDPLLNLQTTPFEELTPYYPTARFLLETNPEVKWDNVSMRVVDLLTPVGKGQRGLIVAPPRTGKTILQQGIANAIMMNNPESHLIVLLVDERPEEVTDFRRQISSGGEVIASTFDENAESHVHAAEMVIEKARRMVEVGQHVVILLDSITRLARAYNTLAGNSGKILSGGVEATAMQKPKRFFGSARNIEGGGSLTILGTALVETGSRMDEVIFEEFKGTGNMELVLDRALVDKRIFPSINLEKSGTRKEELLYHPDELVKVYGLRRAMKGVPSPDAMEMLITRVKKTKTNIEFLMGLNR